MQGAANRPIPNAMLQTADNSQFTVGDSIGLAALLITVVSVVITFPLWFKAVLLSFSAFGCLVFANRSHWTHGWKPGARWSTGAALVAVLAVLGIPQFVEQWKPQPGTTMGSGRGSVNQTTAIFMECEIVSLPLIVPEDGDLHVIPLNRKRVKNQNWGFYDVRGGSKVGSWPDKATVMKSVKTHNPGVWAYKCRVSNHGPTNLIYLGVPIDIWFGDKGGENNRIRYTPVISALDSGKDFYFYLVNDCNISVSAVWQETATVQLLGEPRQRDVPLRRTYISPMDQIMVFFPTTVRWIGGEPCE
jgi:hypothetical protein